MDELVFFQATASAERLSAKLTLMRLDPTVGEDMVLEATRLVEGLATDLTSVRFVTCVDEHVSGEAITSTVELVAYTTLI